MSGQNYIGSKISLISLSDIRYVGILHNISSLEATVGLQNVQSFGTEGRKRNPNEEISPSDNIFDYVVFRGSDIKDLQVFEAPPSYKPESIIQHTSLSASSNGISSNYYTNNLLQQPLLHQFNPYTTNLPATYGNYWPNKQPFIQLQQHQQPVRMPIPENYQPQRQNGEYDIFRNSEQEEKTVAVPVSPQKSILVQQSFSPEKITQIQQTFSQGKQEVSAPKGKVCKTEKVDKITVDSLVKQVSELDIKTPVVTENLIKSGEGKLYKQQEQQQQPQEVSIGTIQTTGTSTSVRNGTAFTQKPNKLDATISAQSRGNIRRASGNRRNSSGIIVPRSDFDFASANAKFDKTAAITHDEDTVLIPEQEQFYNKEKSFFDDISCDSKEYKKGNRAGKYQGERKLNMETFGQASADNSSNYVQNNKRHRHRGRGRGRGNYRGKSVITNSD